MITDGPGAKLQVTTLASADNSLNVRNKTRRIAALL